MIVIIQNILIIKGMNAQSQQREMRNLCESEMRNLRNNNILKNA